MRQDGGLCLARFRLRSLLHLFLPAVIDKATSASRSPVSPFYPRPQSEDGVRGSGDGRLIERRGQDESYVIGWVRMGEITEEITL